jgi:hypothetical protein
VDLNRLIDSVYVPPASPSWFEDLVIQVNRRYDLGKEVKRSSLAEEPFV